MNFQPKIRPVPLEYDAAELYEPADAMAVRKRLGLRLSDVAVAAGCAPQTVRSFEGGLSIRITNALKICRALRQLEQKSGSRVT